jgi:hypothetical protein
MDVLPLALEQALAGDVLDQRVLKAVTDVRMCTPPEDQLSVE